MAHANTTSLMVLSVCGALAAATAVGGCGGASGGVRDAGAGGSGSGAGGKTGGMGGMVVAGTGGATVIPLDCTTGVGVNPSAPLLTDFSSTSWSNNQGKWTSAGRDLTGSKYSAGGGKMDVDAGVTTSMTNNIDTTAANPNFDLTGSVVAGDYAFGLLSFDKCVNTTHYTGVQFTLGGDAAGCDVLFKLQTFDQQGVANKGGCSAASCYNFPTKQITVPSPAAPVTVLFTDLENTGMPATADAMKAQIVGLQWQFQSPPPPDGGAQMGCNNINITIDDVGFTTGP